MPIKNKDIVTELKQARYNLDKWFKDYCRSISCRKSIVKKIFVLKRKKDLHSWDVKREFEFFKKNQLRLQKLSLKELLSFSLIMEEHANNISKSYPKWSNMDHINKSKIGVTIYKSNDFLKLMINPVISEEILLYLISKKLLKKSYQKEIIKGQSEL